MLVDDREDLIAVLRMRFGDIPARMITEIYDIQELGTLQRLILAAANATSWKVFLEEFQEGKESFRIIGEDFNPLGKLLRERDGNSGKEK